MATWRMEMRKFQFQRFRLIENKTDQYGMFDLIEINVSFVKHKHPAKNKRSICVSRSDVLRPCLCQSVAADGSVCEAVTATRLPNHHTQGHTAHRQTAAVCDKTNKHPAPPRHLSLTSIVPRAPPPPPSPATTHLLLRLLRPSSPRICYPLAKPPSGGSHSRSFSGRPSPQTARHSLAALDPDGGRHDRAIIGQHVLMVDDDLLRHGVDGVRLLDGPLLLPPLEPHTAVEAGRPPARRPPPARPAPPSG